MSFSNILAFRIVIFQDLFDILQSTPQQLSCSRDSRKSVWLVCTGVRKMSVYFYSWSPSFYPHYGRLLCYSEVPSRFQSGLWPLFSIYFSFPRPPSSIACHPSKGIHWHTGSFDKCCSSRRCSYFVLQIFFCKRIRLSIFLIISLIVCSLVLSHQGI